MKGSQILRAGLVFWCGGPAGGGIRHGDAGPNAETGGAKTGELLSGEGAHIQLDFLNSILTP